MGVALAAMAGRQDPHSGGQFGRHIEDLFAVADQPLGQRPADAVGTLDRPAALRPAPGPLAQLPVAVQGRGDTLLTEQAAMLVEDGGGVGGLVGVDADHHRHRGAFLERWAGEHREGRPTLRRDNPLLSHSRSGAGRAAQPFLSQPEGGSGVCGATCRHPGTLRAAAPRAPTRHSISRWRVVEVAAPLGGYGFTRATLNGRRVGAKADLGGLALTQSLGVPAGTAATFAYQLARPDAVERIGVDRLRYRLLLRPQAIVRPNEAWVAVTAPV